MKKSIWLLVCSLWISGCGSLMTVVENYSRYSFGKSPEALSRNTYKHCGIYQGVQQDFDILSDFRPLGVALGLVDLPFSFVAGTLALPYTVTTFHDCKKYKYSCDEIGDFPREDCLKKSEKNASDVEEQLNLGFKYARGEGVKQDMTKAKYHFGLACANGSQRGCVNYRRLDY